MVARLMMMMMMIVAVAVAVVDDDVVPDIIVQGIEASFQNEQQDEVSRYTWAIVYTICMSIESCFHSCIMYIYLIIVSWFH